MASDIRFRQSNIYSLSLSFSETRSSWDFSHNYNNGFSPTWNAVADLPNVNKFSKVAFVEISVPPTNFVDHDFNVPGNNKKPSTKEAQTFSRIKFIVVQPVDGSIRVSSAANDTLNGFGLPDIAASGGIVVQEKIPLMLHGESVQVTATSRNIRLRNTGSSPRTVILVYGGD